MVSYRKTYLACGTENWTYLADIDAWKDWVEYDRGNTPKWWEAYPEWQHGDKEDIGDYIIWKQQQNG